MVLASSEPHLEDQDPGVVTHVQDSSSRTGRGRFWSSLGVQLQGGNSRGQGWMSGWGSIVAVGQLVTSALLVLTVEPPKRPGVPHRV